MVHNQVSAVASLALLYAFRMLGLFMVLPLLMLYGAQYRGATPELLGLALGIYGLTQALFQIPLGLWSDKIGRKPIITGGLLLFALGSGLAAWSESVWGLVLGRALQGSGAIASAVMALVADVTSEQHRSRAMAAIGGAIGVSFAVALVLGPALAAVGGLDFVFAVTALLALIGIAIVWGLVPTPQSRVAHRDVSVVQGALNVVLRNAELLRFNFGIFVLHAVLMMFFVCVPFLLETHLGLPGSQHWKFYLPVLGGAFLLMLPPMILAEKARKTRLAFLGAVAVLALSCAGIVWVQSTLAGLVAAIAVFFLAFNLLEALLPSLVSKVAPAGMRGAAMGVYSTAQFLGAFVGGSVGGVLYASHGPDFTFTVAALASLVWLVLAFPMSAPRHLANLKVSARDSETVDALITVPGVIDVLHVPQEAVAYLKVDRDIVSDDDFARLSAFPSQR